MTDDNQSSGTYRPGLHPAQLTAAIVLVVVFLVFMVLIILDSPWIRHDILAIGGIVVVLASLLVFYFPTRQFTRELEKAYRELERVTITDKLTQAYNREHFNSLLQRELSRARRYKKNLACLMLEIDHFDDINKKYGYQVGNEILQDIAEIMKENLRDTDILARYDSNRFVCLLPESDHNGSMFLSKRLRGLIEGSSYDTTGDTVQVTVSMGLTYYDPAPEDMTDIRNIIQLAEQALNKARENGGNRIEVAA